MAQFDEVVSVLVLYGNFIDNVFKEQSIQVINSVF